MFFIEARQNPNPFADFGGFGNDLGKTQTNSKGQLIKCVKVGKNGKCSAWAIASNNAAQPATTEKPASGFSLFTNYGGVPALLNNAGVKSVSIKNSMPTTRRITLTGNGTLKTSFGSPDTLSRLLQPLFEKQGWRVINFVTRNTSPIYQLANLSFDFTLVAEVSNNYTNQQHTDMAAQIFKSYHVTFGGYLELLHIEASGDDKPDTTYNNKVTNQISLPNTPTSSSGNSYFPTLPGGTSFLDNFASGLGISTAVLLSVGVLAAVIVLKK